MLLLMGFSYAYLTTFSLLTRRLLYVQPEASTQTQSQHMSQRTNSIFTTMRESVWYQMLSLLITPGHNTILSHCSNLLVLILFLVWCHKQDHQYYRAVQNCFNQTQNNLT